MHIFWLNYQGKRVLYKVLAPRSACNQPTYLTHPWLVSSSSGTCLEILEAATTNNTAVIPGTLDRGQVML